MTNAEALDPIQRIKRLAQRALVSIIADAGADEISRMERLTPKRTKCILRQEQRYRWFAPAKYLAPLQIALLGQMSLKLLHRLQDGDLRMVNRPLKIVDLVDCYHGSRNAKRLAEPYGEEERVRLLRKINEIADRLKPG